jgi:hypothetical protein
MPEIYDRLSPTLEKIETLAHLRPLLPTDAEYGVTMAVLMEIISDYSCKLRRDLNALGEYQGPSGRR